MKNDMLTPACHRQEVAATWGAGSRGRKFYDEHKSEYNAQGIAGVLPIVISTKARLRTDSCRRKESQRSGTRRQEGEKFNEWPRDNSDDVETARTGGKLAP